MKRSDKRRTAVKPHSAAIAGRDAISAGMLVLLSALVAAPAPAHALPLHGTVVGGTATISQPNATTMTVSQSSANAIINWNGYSIGAHESVKYLQPGSSSIALNRVTGVDPSYIYGLLSGNGQVWVINPNGLLVGPGATVQTGSFLASTMNITNENFLSGKYLFTNTPDSQAAIVNQGSITAANGGYVVLAAPSVANAGSIVANLGTVHLAAGDTVTLSLNNGNLINVAVSGAVAAEALGVTNSGHIAANGGQVVLTARVAGDVMKSVVNNEGIIEAKAIDERGGTIILDNGDSGITANSGTLDASGKNAGETGGTVKILGDKVGLFAGSVVDVSGNAGGGTVLVGGNFHGAGAEKNASMTYVDKDATIKADALVNGNGGKVAVWAEDATRFYGAISAQGGIQGGDGGFVEVSGKHGLTYAGVVNLGAALGATGTLLLDPDEITIIHATDASLDTADTIPLSAPFVDTSTVVIPSNISDFTINSQLSAANVTIKTSTDSISSKSDVVININSKSLTLDSAKDITLGGIFNDSGLGTLALKVGQSGAGGILTIPVGTTIAAHSVDITGGSGADTIDVSHWSGAASIHDTIGGDIVTGNGTVTTLIGSDASSAFLISAPNAGSNTTTGTTFSGIKNLLGGSNSDSFTLAAGVTRFNGSIAGGGGTDTMAATNGTNSWQTNGTSSGTLNTDTTFAGITNLTGGSGIDTFTIGIPAFSGVISGGGGSDTLIAPNSTNLWKITGANAGTLNTITSFAGITNLTGGSGSDAFTLNADVTTFGGSIAGGGGTDTLAATNGTNNWLTTGTNSGTLNTSTSFSGITSMTGGSGADTFTLGASSFSGSIIGGGGTDTLVATNGTNNWQVTGANAGTLNTITTFTGITNLAGGSGTDTLTGRNTTNVWNITDTNTVTLDGMNAAGMNALVGSSNTDTFRLATGVSTFNGSITGGGGTDTLIATNGTNNWHVTGLNAGTLNGTTTFSGITNLTGGSGTDIFALAADVPTFTGSITGGGGTDTLAATNGSNSWQVTGTNSGTLNGSTTFTGIANLSGGADTDTLIGQNSINTTGWSITDSNAVTLNGINATRIEILAGGTGKDIFTLAAGVPTFNGQVIGGGGLDTLAATNGTNNWQMTGAGTGTLNGTTTFSGITNLTGGSGTDNFTLSADVATFSGLITGGGGTDTLAATNGTNNWQTTATNSGTLNGTTTFTGITNLSGGSDTDTLIGRGVVNIWNITGANAVTLDGMNATSMNTLLGGSVADNFKLAAGASTFNGQITGGGGTDTLTMTDGANTWQLTGANVGTLNGNTSFSGITTLVGGSGTDTFTLGAGISTFNGSISGGGGTDTLAATDGNNSWQLNGTTGGTLNSTTSFAGITNLAGGTGTDTLIGTVQIYTLDNFIQNKGSNGTVSWTSMENLTDTSSGTFNMGTGGKISGGLDGGADGTLNYNSYATPVTLNLSGPGTTGIGGSWTGITMVTGSSKNDTVNGTGKTYNLSGMNAGNSDGIAWRSFEKIADTDAGTISSSGGQTYNVTDTNLGNMTLLSSGFTGISSLTDADAGIFNFVNAGHVDGNIIATKGTLNYSLHSSAVEFNLVDRTGTGIGGTWNGITNITGSGYADTMGGSNTIYNLTGLNSGNSSGVFWSSFEKIVDAGAGTIATIGGQTYNLTGANSGNVTNLLAGGFTGISDLHDSDAGVFNMHSGADGSVSGTISATGGKLNYAGYDSAVTFGLNGTADGTGGWSGITNVIGSSSSDTISGTGATYNLKAPDAGNGKAPDAGNGNGVSWTSFENLHDTTAGIFRFNSDGAVSGSITAVGGTLDYSAGIAGPVTVDLTVGTGTNIGNSWNGITTIIGSASLSDTVTGSKQTFNLTGADAGNIGSVGWTSFENIIGVAGANTYVGSGGSLSGAIVDNGTTATLQGNIQTGGDQIYNGAATLGAVTTLTSTDSGAITFVGTLNSDATPQELTIDTAGVTTFGGAVGTIAPLKSLTVINNSGTTAINGGSVITSGSVGQAYHNAAVLGADTSLNSGSGAITFTDSVSGTQSLDLTAGNADITFSGPVSLNAIMIKSAKNFTAVDVTATSLNQTSGSGATTLNGTVDIITIDGINIATGGSIINNGSVTSSGGGPVILAAGIDIAINNAITGDGPISLTAGHDIINNGRVTSSRGGPVIIAAGSDIAIHNAIASDGPISLTAGHAISEGYQGSVITAGLLTTQSTQGQDLVGGGTNSVGSFNATNTVSGEINLTNSSSPLTIAGINQAGGQLAITNNGGITSSAPLIVSGATTIIAADQPITLTDPNNNFTGLVTLTGAVTQLTAKNNLAVALNTTGTTTLLADADLNLSGTSTDSVSATAGNKVILSDPTASILHITGATVGGFINNSSPLDMTTTSTQTPITVNLTGSLPFLTYVGSVKENIMILGLYNGAVVMGTELDHYKSTTDLKAATTALAVYSEKTEGIGALARFDDFFKVTQLESLINYKEAFKVPEKNPKLRDR